jgi:hypothetical protein
MTEVVKKRCTACKEEFPANRDYFTVDRKAKDGLYCQCKSCKSKARREAHKRIAEASLNGHSHTSVSIDKLAVIIPLGTSEKCGSCGTTRGNILGDIDKVTREKYGYLCARCYRLVRDFQEDSERMRKVLDYVEQTRQKVPTASRP